METIRAATAEPHDVVNEAARAARCLSEGVDEERKLRLWTEVLVGCFRVFVAAGAVETEMEVAAAAAISEWSLRFVRDGEGKCEEKREGFRDWNLYTIL